MKYYIVDAFTDELFKGNQAGICTVEETLETKTMQEIAIENNLSETAFVEKKDGYYGLRWFTPEVEMDLCGHATLASAFVICNFIDRDTSLVRFETLSGTLTVEKKGDLYELDFPTRRPERIEVTDLMSKATGYPVKEAYMSRDMMLVFDNDQQIRDMEPDLELMKQLPDCFAVIVTAEGSESDFVSRVFIPDSVIPEDPVTGSTHCTLIPFWAERLGKDKMVSKQLSRRGGTLFCENCGDRVKIAGKAVLYLQGEIFM